MSKIQLMNETVRKKDHRTNNAHKRFFRAIKYFSFQFYCTKKSVRNKMAWPFPGMRFRTSFLGFPLGLTSSRDLHCTVNVFGQSHT